MTTMEKHVAEFTELLVKEKRLIKFEDINDLQQVNEGAFAIVYKATWRGNMVILTII